MNSAHLTRCEAGDDINIRRGKKFRDVIAPFLVKPTGRGVEFAFRRKWIKYENGCY